MADGLKNTTQADKHKLARHWLVILGLTLGLGVTILVALSTGRYPIPLDDLVNLLSRVIFSPGSPATNVQETVLFNVRPAADLGSPYGGAGWQAAAIAPSPSFAIPWWILPFWAYPPAHAVGAALAILLSLGIEGIQLCSFGFGLSPCC